MYLYASNSWEIETRLKPNALRMPLKKYILNHPDLPLWSFNTSKGRDMVRYGWVVVFENLVSRDVPSDGTVTELHEEGRQAAAAAQPREKLPVQRRGVRGPHGCNGNGNVHLSPISNFQIEYSQGADAKCNISEFGPSRDRLSPWKSNGHASEIIKIALSMTSSDTENKQIAKLIILNHHVIFKIL